MSCTQLDLSTLILDYKHLVGAGARPPTPASYMVTTTLTRGGAATEGSTAEGHLPETGHLPAAGYLPAAAPAPPDRTDDRKNMQPQTSKLMTPKVLGRDGAGRGGLSDCVSKTVLIVGVTK